MDPRALGDAAAARPGAEASGRARLPKRAAAGGSGVGLGSRVGTGLESAARTAHSGKEAAASRRVGAHPTRRAEWRAHGALPESETLARGPRLWSGALWPGPRARSLGGVQPGCPGLAARPGAPNGHGRHRGGPARPRPPLPRTHRRGPRTPAPGPRSMAPGRPPVRPSVPQRRGPAFCAAAAAPPRAEVSLPPTTAPEVTSGARGGRRDRSPSVGWARVRSRDPASGGGAGLLVGRGLRWGRAPVGGSRVVVGG